MSILLIVYQLSIESSYIQNLERDTDGDGDTIQFFQADNDSWRIKTYAIDRDVHVWNIGKLSAGELDALAETNSRTHYGEVILKKTVLRTSGGLEEIQKKLLEAYLPSNLEVGRDEAFAFWAPVANEYATRSSPQ